jgi:signal transduction histidine kinase
LVEDALLVPFYVEGKAVGTIWAVTHGPRHKFDAEDERVMRSLGKFASSAYQTVVSLDRLRSQIAERETAQASLRTLADSLETKVSARTQELEERNGEVLQQSEQLRELSNRLVETQDQERRHLARELHDSVGQILAALGMNLTTIDSLGRGIPGHEKATQESYELIQQISKEIRIMSYLLHPPLLDERGLTAAIRWYIDGLMERSNLKIELELYDDLGRLPVEMEMSLFRIVQECLTNIHRHSGSETAKIRLSRDGRSVSLEIRDAGIGMSAEKLARIRAQHSGVGITGMRERIRHFRGTMEIRSGVNGTTVSVRLPMSQ